MIENYQGDCSTKELLLSVYDSRQPGCPIVCKVSDLSYVVLGLPSTNNPFGYAHVKNNKTGLFCCSKDSECNAFALKGKYERARKFCSHLHALFCVGVSVSTDNSTCTETPQESQPSQLATSILSDLSLQRSNTVKLQSTRKIPFNIAPELPREIDERNRCVDLHWPTQFFPKQELKIVDCVGLFLANKQNIQEVTGRPS
jgi:hypothetical protein